MELPRVEYRCWKEWAMKKCIQSSLSDQVSTMLKEQILNGQLKGGEKERCKALIHEHVFHCSIDLGAPR